MRKNILLGVTAGVAIYKSCSLARMLKKNGFRVKVVMTPNAAKLISSQLFESLTCEPVYIEMFQERKEYCIEHIGLAQWADCALIVPASANTIAKLALGVCDNLLTTVMLSLPKKTHLYVAAAMNTNMWKHPATKQNINTLKKFKNCKIISPCKGLLACGDKGEGVLAPLEEIVKEVKKALK